MIQNNFLDLEQILVNELFGGLTLFIIVALLIILLVAVKTRIPFSAISILLCLFIFILFAHFMEEVLILYVFAILYIGVLLYYTISKAMK